MPHRVTRRLQRLIAALLCLLAPVAGLWWLRGGSLPGLHRLRSKPESVQVAAGELPLLAIHSGTASQQGPLIRVGLTPDPVDEVTLAVTGPFKVRSQSGGTVLFHGEHLNDTRVTASSRGIRIGTREFTGSMLEISPKDSPSVWVGDHQYRGKVQFHRKPANQVFAVNVLPLEDYVASVVDSEMPTEFGREARKAQAIVARTYALYQMRTATGGQVVDLFATVRSQKYLGAQYRSGGRSLAGESADSRQVVAETHGLVCTVGGQLFCTYYCATCGGRTLLGSDFFPDAATPLQSVACNWCQAAKFYRWEADLPREDWLTAVRNYCVSNANAGRFGNLVSLKPISTAPGRMPQYEARGTAATLRVTGADLRQVLNEQGVAVYSPRFSIENRGGRVHLRGAGSGHGVGLCQWGARGLGKAGYSAQEIVRYYYPGSQIVAADYR